MQHTDPDYSVAYVVLETDSAAALRGYGLTFTVGRGTEIGESHKSNKSTNMSYDHVVRVDPESYDFNNNTRLTPCGEIDFYTLKFHSNVWISYFF